MQDDREPAVRITVCDQGPLIIRGDFALQVIPTSGPSIRSGQ